MRTLETQGRTISAYTRRNVRNDIRKVFKLAEAHGLLTAPLPSRLLPRPASREAFRRQQRATAPYKTTYGTPVAATATACRRRSGPPISARAGGPTGAACGGRIRETSFQSYVKFLETYCGYIAQHLWPYPHVGRPL